MISHFFVTYPNERQNWLFFLLVQASMCQRSCNLSWQSHTQEYMYLNLKDVKLNLNVLCDRSN